MAKKTIAEAKSKACEAMYNHLGTKEDQNGIYRLAKRIGVREIGVDSESSFDFGVQPSMSRAEVKGALHKMGRGKATEPDQIPIEEWRLSMVVPIYKNKGDAQDCSNYRGIKLLSHTMKLWEIVIETRLKSKVEVLENQFGFMPGRSTLEAIHLLRQLMEKYRVHSKDLHLMFIDLEKAYDSVRREVIWESLVAKRGVMDIFEGDTRNVFSVIMDVLTRGIQDSVHWCMLFANDIVIIHETRIAINVTLERWRYILESNGLRVSRSKTKYLWCNFSNQPNVEGVDVLMGDQVLPPKDNFRNKLRAAPIAEKVREGRLRWFGHIRRRRVAAPVRRVENLLVSGSRRRGRPMRTWTDLLTLDLRALNLSDDITSDRRSWRKRISVAD
ncbi:uncharacterized protein LOC141704020 [Apium graveolens]|uniref:uncharacterized protein LOC141704020 n=1 Tax=Apium graveolens TaxID=4045 RepID=UPI003D78DAB9